MRPLNKTAPAASLAFPFLLMLCACGKPPDAIPRLQSENIRLKKQVSLLEERTEILEGCLREVREDLTLLRSRSAEDVPVGNFPPLSGYVFDARAAHALPPPNAFSRGTVPPSGLLASPGETEEPQTDGGGSELGEVPSPPSEERWKADGFFQSGVMYQSQGMFEEALQSYEKCISLNPDNAFAHYNRGCIFDVSRNYAAAMESYGAALEANPLYTEARYNLAITYHRMGEPEKSMEAYHKVLEERENMAGAHLGLAALYEKYLGDREKALLHYRNFLQQAKDPVLQEEVLRRVERLSRGTGAEREGGRTGLRWEIREKGERVAEYKKSDPAP